MGNTNRQCSIEIENKTSEYTLRNPNRYTYSGRPETDLPKEIGPSGSGSGLFIKTSGTACGAVGVFTYDLMYGSTDYCDGKVAVMFSVPFDYNLYSNMYAVGVFHKTKKCNYNLYNEMYYGKEKEFKRGKAADGRLTYKSDQVTITATMSDSYESVIKVQIVEELRM